MNGRVDDDRRALLPITIRANLKTEPTSVEAWIDTAFMGTSYSPQISSKILNAAVGTNQNDIPLTRSDLGSYYRVMNTSVEQLSDFNLFAKKKLAENPAASLDSLFDAWWEQITTKIEQP